jgi:MFS family permease
MFQLAFLRAISSFFIGGAAPVINAIIAVSSEKKHQGVVYGINSSVGAAGNALGPLIGSATAMLSYRLSFLTTGIILGLAAWQTARRRKQSGSSSPAR